MAGAVDTRGRSESSLSSRLNRLRAGVLGANDGIVSTAGLVFGVAGATSDRVALIIAGLAGVVAGSLSMGGGEYVSVSSQRDMEIAVLARQRRIAESNPDVLRDELRDYYLDQGLSPDLADKISADLGDEGALKHHARTTMGLDSAEPVSPSAAALASMGSFAAGAAIPLLAMVLAPHDIRLPLTLVAVWIALLLTGYISARLSSVGVGRPMLRNLVVGSLAMGLTYLVGTLVGTQLS